MTLRTGLILAAVLSFPAHALAQDADAGEKAYSKCKTCHMIGDNAKNTVGPIHTGIVGRAAGTVENYAYSPLNKAAGAAGLVWTEQNIIDYLPDPNAFLKKFLTDKGKADQATGSTKMTFKLASEQERKDIVAYLKKFPAK